MSRYLKLATNKQITLLPDYAIDNGPKDITFYIDSNTVTPAEIIADISEDGALDKLEAYNDDGLEQSFAGYSEFVNLTRNGIGYALTLSRKSDDAAIKSLSTQVSDITKENATTSKAVEQNSDDITNLQMAVASLYEQSQTATTDKEADK